MSSNVVRESTVIPVEPEVDPRLGKTTVRSFLRSGKIGQIPVVVALVLIAIFFQIRSDGLFLNSQNINNLLLQIATIGMLGLASVLVLLIGEIDLSLGVVSYVCAAVTGVLSVEHGWGAAQALLAGLVVGAVIGLVNGFFVAILRVPSFVVTLAGLLAYQGVVIHILFPQTSLLLTDPNVANIATTYLSPVLGWVLPLGAVALYIVGIAFGRVQRLSSQLAVTPLWIDSIRIGLAVVVVVGSVAILQAYLGVPQSTAILMGAILLFWLLMRFTAFGRHIYAVGGSAEAARRAGINVTRIRIIVFVLASTLAAVGGILQASRLDTAASDVDQTLLLNAIATAVIGGVSLFGGRGSVWAVVLGSLVIGSLSNGLALLNYNTDVKYIVEGIVLIIAVTIDALGRQGLPFGTQLQELLRQYWKVVTRPGWRAFAEGLGKAAWGITLAQLFGYAVIVAILTVLTPVISATTSPFVSAGSSFVATVIGFFILQGLFYGLAKAFGGQGTFVRQAYTFLLFQAPLGILSSLLGILSSVLALIPVAGALLGIAVGVIILAVGIYELVLSVLAVMGVHKLSSGKATAVVLIPVVALAVLGIILYVALIAAALRGG